MGDYNRTTRECSFAQLRPEIVAAVRDHAARHEWGNLELEVLACVETASEKKKKGLFGLLPGADPDPVHHTAALLTRDRLIWVRSGPKSGVVVTWAQLSQIEVKDFRAWLKEVGMSGKLDDTGMSVFGFVNRSPERVSAFIGLGSEAAAGRFQDAVKAAVERAR